MYPLGRAMPAPRTSDAGRDLSGAVAGVENRDSLLQITLSLMMMREAMTPRQGLAGSYARHSQFPFCSIAKFISNTRYLSRYPAPF